MRKIYIFLSLIAMIMVSCTTDTDPMANQDLAQSRNTPQARTPGDGKYEVLGYGYDVTGEYLVHASVKQQVIDVEGFIEGYPHRFDNPFIGETTTRIYGGDNFYSYLKDVQKNSGITLGAWYKGSAGAAKSTFSGEGNRSTQSKYSYSSKYSFARGEVVKRQRQYYIDASANTLSNYLSTKFKEDLQLLSADQIVAKYGTHVLIDVEVGGMLKAFLKSTITKEESTTVKTKSAKAALGLNFKKFGISLGGSSSSTTTEAYVKNNDYWEFTLETIGSSTNGYNITFSSKDPNPQHTINLGAWAQSVDDNHSRLVNINWESTYPLYDFIADPTKKAQIKAAVDNYIDSKKKEVLKLKPLYRLWDSGQKNTFYSTSETEVNHYINTWNYRLDYGYNTHYIIGYVLEDNNSNSAPLYRLWDNREKNTFYSTSEAEVNHYINVWNYRLDYGYNTHYIIGYVDKRKENDDLVPLYRLWDNREKNTFYSTSEIEVNHYINAWNYRLDYGYNTHYIIGYIYPKAD